MPVSTGAFGSLRVLMQSKEILHVVDRSVAEAVFVEDGILADFTPSRYRPKAAAVELQGGLGAAELEATVVDGGAHHAFIHYVEPGVTERGLNGVGAIPFVEDVFVAEHLRLAGVSDFMAQCATSIQCANRSVMAPPPKFQYQRQRLYFSRLKGCSGVAPSHCFQSRVGCRLASASTRLVIVLPPIGSDLGDSAQPAPLNELDGITKVSPAALLHPALQDLFAGAHRLGEGRALFDGVGNGLFQVDIFAGRHCLARDAHMPVVRRQR